MFEKNYNFLSQNVLKPFFQIFQLPKTLEAKRFCKRKYFWKNWKNLEKSYFLFSYHQIFQLATTLGSARFYKRKICKIRNGIFPTQLYYFGAKVLRHFFFKFFSQLQHFSTTTTHNNFSETFLLFKKDGKIHFFIAILSNLCKTP